MTEAVKGLSGLLKRLAGTTLFNVDHNNPTEGVVVGFTQNYALPVHEKMRVNHPVGEAKFLENATKENLQEIKRIVTESYVKGMKMNQGLILAALRIQREAQKKAPVDTGALKASSFTALAKNEQQNAARALKRSNQLKNNKGE